MKLILKVDRVKTTDAGAEIIAKIASVEAPARLLPDGTVQAKISGLNLTYKGKTNAKAGDEIKVTLLP